MCMCALLWWCILAFRMQGSGPFSDCRSSLGLDVAAGSALVNSVVSFEVTAELQPEKLSVTEAASFLELSWIWAMGVLKQEVP